MSSHSTGSASSRRSLPPSSRALPAADQAFGRASQNEAWLRDLMRWRLRVYLGAFATGVAVHVAAHGGIDGIVVCTGGIAAAAYGCWRRNNGGWLRLGVFVALAYTLLVPLAHQRLAGRQFGPSCSWR
jgi:hypothetical protein